MTAIGSSYSWPSVSSSSAWQDLQDWQAKMTAANGQFESDTSQYTDTLLSAPVTQSQGMATIIAQEMSARAASSGTQSLAGGNTTDSSGDVYWGPDGNANVSSSPSGSSLGSNPDVYWGMPQVDIKV